MPWWDEATCRRQWPGLWDLDSDERYIQMGQRICQACCPVRQQCLSDAFRLGDQGVVRGGVRMEDGWSTRPRDIECLGCSGKFVGHRLRRYCSRECMVARYKRDGIGGYARLDQGRKR